ncbi:MAG: hypothetical protein IJP27_09495 [Clostridia bacterium]|nr:hypothetical protein [Clostridia bacterium]
MFEEQYRKMNQAITPSEALNDETFALMKEAQDHRAAPPPKPLRWKPALIASAGGLVAAMLVGVVLLGFWLQRDPKIEEDQFGSLEQVFEEDMAGSSQPPKTEKPENEAPTQDPEAAPEDDGLAENNGTGTAPDPSEPNDEEAENDEKVEEGGDENGSAALEGDPRLPDVINDGTTVTYLSIREFLNALSDEKKTPGYGKNYYQARELLIVPSRLPEQSRFRHMHLDTETGKYSYSYLFTAEGKEYFLDIEVDAKTPKTLRDLNLKKDEVRNETVQTGQKGDQLFYLFGKEDYIIVTVSEVNSMVALTEEQVSYLMAPFALERCTITNLLVDMTY